MIKRRNFLHGLGVTLALPAFRSLSARASETKVESHGNKRFVAIGAYLGLHQPAFFPKKAGANYDETPLLRPLREHRQDFSVLSGLDHRAVNGHQNWPTFLCGRQLGGVSLDQIIANKLGDKTRYQSLQLTAGEPTESMSFSRLGVPLPAEQRPSVVFSKLFTTAGQRARNEYLLKSGRSTLDFVKADASSIRAKLNPEDRAKMDQYLESLRETEKGIERQLKRVHDPVPATDYVLPSFDPLAPSLMLQAESLMYDMMALALEIDASRVLTMSIDGRGQVFTINGKALQAGYHALSHHGNDPSKIRDLIKLETEHMKCLSRFLTQLKTKTDSDGRPLLDSTVVLFGSGMGDASRHDNSNLPTLVAGGKLQHGKHLQFAGKDAENYLLGDLFISLQRAFGIEAEKFSNADKGLDDLLL